MDPRDGLRPTPEQIACTACGAGVPADRLRILARRDAPTAADVPAMRPCVAVRHGDLPPSFDAR